MQFKGLQALKNVLCLSYEKNRKESKMTNVSTNIKKFGVYLGYFTIHEHTTNLTNNNPSRTYNRLVFTNAEGLELRDFKAMGDIVYGMYVNDQLLKIGKAGSSNGWKGRISQYGNDPKNERTNRKIITGMKQEFDFNTKIHVYGFSVPRITTEYFCPITNETKVLQLAQNNEVETLLTAEAEEQGENLIFVRCKI